MSRIEKSLEKAIEMRKSLQKEAGGETAASPAAKQDIARFQPAAPVINPEAVDDRIVCIKEPNSLITEQYKKLRARVLKSTAGDFLNTMMVTSSGVGEGKTITAINFAVAVASQIDHTVLLVDADLRNPSVHKYLGINPSRGLSDYLKGDVRLSSALIRTGIGRLVLLPAGNLPENPSELLSSQRMKDLVMELKNRYRDRYVIFDSSPLLVTADPISLAGYMDGVLLVVKAAHTTPKNAIKALSLVKGCRILGTVFNNVPDHLKKNIYPYYTYGKTSDNGQRPEMAGARD